MFPCVCLQVIVIIALLAHPINHGYNHVGRIPRLLSCNGVDVRSMKHLKELVDQASQPEPPGARGWMRSRGSLQCLL